jgi:hypothetical protein
VVQYAVYNMVKSGRGAAESGGRKEVSGTGSGCLGSSKEELWWWLAGMVR